MCKLCPTCAGCGTLECDAFGGDAVCNTYCHRQTPDNHPLRHEPCFPHQSYGYPHDTPDRYDEALIPARSYPRYRLFTRGLPFTLLPMLFFVCCGAMPAKWNMLAMLFERCPSLSLLPDYS